MEAKDLHKSSLYIIKKKTFVLDGKILSLHALQLLLFSLSGYYPSHWAVGQLLLKTAVLFTKLSASKPMQHLSVLVMIHDVLLCFFLCFCILFHSSTLYSIWYGAKTFFCCQKHASQSTTCL